MSETKITKSKEIVLMTEEQFERANLRDGDAFKDKEIIVVPWWIIVFIKNGRIK